MVCALLEVEKKRLRTAVHQKIEGKESEKRKEATWRGDTSQGQRRGEKRRDVWGTGRGEIRKKNEK